MNYRTYLSKIMNNFINTIILLFALVSIIFLTAGCFASKTKVETVYKYITIDNVTTIERDTILVKPFAESCVQSESIEKVIISYDKKNDSYVMDKSSAINLLSNTKRQKFCLNLYKHWSNEVCDREKYPHIDCQ